MKLAIQMLSLAVIGGALGVFFGYCFIKDLDYTEAKQAAAREERP
jgi:hypothetical protein